MLQNPCKTLGFKKNMVYKIPPGGGGKPYPASGLIVFLNNTDLDPLKFTKPPTSAFNVGPSSARSETPFKWCFAGRPIMAR